MKASATPMCTCSDTCKPPNLQPHRVLTCSPNLEPYASQPANPNPNPNPNPNQG